MVMKIQIALIVSILLILGSCSYETLVYNRNDMEATIPKSAKIQFQNKSKINRNDIVIFEYHDKTVNDEMTNALRVVGLPGDTIVILNSQIYINGKLVNTPKERKLGYKFRINNLKEWRLLDKYSFRKIENEYDRIYFLTDNELNEIKKLGITDSIALYGSDSSFVSKNVVSNSSFKYFNVSYFGPLVVPKKGAEITEDIVNISPLCVDNKIGQKLNEDVFFVLGDNFHWSYDSRIFGILPRSKIRGVAYKWE